jgi:hypothetical protein
MKEEVTSLKEYGVYKFIPRDQVPLNKTVLNIKPVYARQRNMNGAMWK